MADISIVLVTYNRAQFLPKTLDSILNQSYRDFELIIRDDCSTDGTEEICRRYAAQDKRIRYFLNSVNLGMPGNLNAGIASAQCEFIANLHDGDIYHPMLLENWRAALMKYPTAGFVFNIYRHLDANGESGQLTDCFPEFIPGDEFLRMCFNDRDLECPVWGTVMARREVYDTLGLFNRKYSFWSDFDMWFRIAERYNVAFVPETLIDLPSKKTMPHLFNLGHLKTHLIIFRVYWEARCRYYREQPRLLVRELAKQIIDFSWSRIRGGVRRLLPA